MWINKHRHTSHQHKHTHTHTHLPSTRTMQDVSTRPPEFSATQMYWPSSSGRALSMVRDNSPPVTTTTTTTLYHSRLLTKYKKTHCDSLVYTRGSQSGGRISDGRHAWKADLSRTLITNQFHNNVVFVVQLSPSGLSLRQFKCPGSVLDWHILQTPGGAHPNNRHKSLSKDRALTPPDWHGKHTILVKSPTATGPSLWSLWLRGNE